MNRGDVVECGADMADRVTGALDVVLLNYFRIANKSVTLLNTHSTRLENRSKWMDGWMWSLLSITYCIHALRHFRAKGFNKMYAH